MISSITNYNRYRAARLPVGSIFEKKTTLYLQRHKRQKIPCRVSQQGRGMVSNMKLAMPSVLPLDRCLVSVRLGVPLLQGCG